MIKNLKPFAPHAVAIGIFFALVLTYFYPAFSGYQLKQGDITQFRGMSQEISEFREMYGEEPLWTNSMFGGMPAYQISVKYPNDILGLVDKVFTLGLPRPANYVFLYLIGFYILMISMRIKPHLAVVAAVAFAFSTYYFIILEAGHNSKAHAIGYMAPVLAGIVLAYRGKFLLGGIVTAFFMALQLHANHVQITYYFGLFLIVYGIAKAIEKYKEGEISEFGKSSGIIVLAVILGVLANSNVLFTTYNYGKYTTRGTTELTIQADGTSNESIETAGLDREYVTQWSYGIGESLTFLIPNARGGATGLIGIEGAANNEIARPVQQSVAQSNAYWGDQPFVSGPVYMGAIVILCFLLGAIFVRGPLKWGLITIVLLTVALSWGKNFMGLTDFFLDYIPAYNKFRAVTIILAITEFAVPILAFLFIRKLIVNREEIEAQRKKLLLTGGILSGIVLILIMAPQSFFNFLSAQEEAMLSARMGEQGGAQILEYAEGLQTARASIFRSDALRTLLFLLTGFACIWLFMKGKLKEIAFISLLGVLVLVDLWSVDKRYVNNEKDRGRYVQWEDKSAMKSAYKAASADNYILESEIDMNPGVYEAVEKAASETRSEFKAKRERVDEGLVDDAKFAALRFNTNYRVLPLSGTFQDSRTAYFHKSIGGYHGAKLKRIQELYDFHISAEINRLTSTLQENPTASSVNQALSDMGVLNMLNTKYIIYNPDAPPIANTEAYGSAWFVEEPVLVSSADEEILKLGEIDTRYEAVIDRRFESQVSGFQFQETADAAIAVEEHLPNYIRYIYDSPVEQMAVFSEIYYDDGWKAYIDGQEAPYFRANYILRAMRIPAGEHTIEFKFEPQVYQTASLLSTVMQLILVLIVAFGVFRFWKHKGVS